MKVNIENCVKQLGSGDGNDDGRKSSIIEMVENLKETWDRIMKREMTCLSYEDDLKDEAEQIKELKHERDQYDARRREAIAIYEERRAEFLERGEELEKLKKEKKALLEIISVLGGSPESKLEIISVLRGSPESKRVAHSPKATIDEIVEAFNRDSKNDVEFYKDGYGSISHRTPKGGCKSSIEILDKHGSDDEAK